MNKTDEEVEQKLRKLREYRVNYSKTYSKDWYERVGKFNYKSKTCEICNGKVSKYGYNHHIKRIKHQKALLTNPLILRLE
jgi:hypothetical protein